MSCGSSFVAFQTGFSCLSTDKSGTRDSCVTIRTITLNIEERKIESCILSVREIKTLQTVIIAKGSANKVLGRKISSLFFETTQKEQLYLIQNSNSNVNFATLFESNAKKDTCTFNSILKKWKMKKCCSYIFNYINKKIIKR